MNGGKGGGAHPRTEGHDSRRPPIGGPRTRLDFDDGAFPAALRVIPRPPAALRVIGDPDALEEGIAIIGARRATPYGLGCARRFARIAASLGICVISGGALGCDSEAHRGALDVGGKTVAFLGGGCDEVYPARNVRLFQRIVDEGGAIASERDWSEPPLPWMFPERNRLIAGLAKATLVVEAGLPSGTFGTADAALAAGKEVLAVPSAITSPTSAGANRLIAQGAMPIVDDDSFESALSMLFGVLRREASAGGPQMPDDPLLAAVMACPMRMEELVEAGLAESPLQLNLELARLEKAGAVTRYPDGRYGPTSAWMLGEAR